MRRLEADGGIFDIVQISSDSQQVIVSGENAIFVWNLDGGAPIVSSRAFKLDKFV